MASEENASSGTAEDKATTKGRARSKSRASARSGEGGGGKRSGRSARSDGASRARARARKAVDQMPGWASSLGPVIGMGLFATRRQWLPHAEQWEEQLRDRFARFREGNETYDFDDLDDDEDDAGQTGRFRQSGSPHADALGQAKSESAVSHVPVS
jgi:hypothetical protein